MIYLRLIAVCMLCLLALRKDAARAQELVERTRSPDREETGTRHGRGDSLGVSERNDRPEAFGTMTLGAGAAHPLLQPLSEGWYERTGIQVFLETPVYHGRAEVGIRAHFQSRAIDEVPGLRTGLIYLGWGAGIRLPWRIRAQVGARLGMYVMRFAAAAIAPNAHIEQEVGLFAVASLDRAVGDRWSLRASANVGSVMLSSPVRQAYVELGVGYTFRTPRRLREALR